MRQVLIIAALCGVTATAYAQQSTHTYFFRAAFTVEGMKDLQNRSATALKAGLAKLNGSAGCKVESWYFLYGEGTAVGFVNCPDEIAAATLASAGNTFPYAHVTYQSVLSAEDADKALVKAKSLRPAQNQ
jgi:uncharacterized protein with GYD domain